MSDVIYVAIFYSGTLREVTQYRVHQKVGQTGGMHARVVGDLADKQGPSSSPLFNMGV